MKEKNNKRVRKGLLPAIAMVALSFVASAGATYAWWNTIRIEHEETITIGDRVGIFPVENEVVGNNLVPVGQANGDGQVDVVLFEYKVEVMKNTKGDTIWKDLKISVDEFLVGGVDTYNDYFKLVIGTQNLLEGEHLVEDIATGTYDYTITLTLDIQETDPARETKANNVKGKLITFTTIFELVE